MSSEETGEQQEDRLREKMGLPRRKIADYDSLEQQPSQEDDWEVSDTRSLPEKMRDWHDTVRRQKEIDEAQQFVQEIRRREVESLGRCEEILHGPSESAEDKLRRRFHMPLREVKEDY